METYCFTRQFTNKSSYRSMKNIKDNILNTSFNQYQKVVKDIFKTKSNEIDPRSQNQVMIQLKPILLTLIRGYKKLCKDDFKHFFNSLKQKNNDASNVDVDEISNVVIGILHKLIDHTFYGCGKNKKLFMNLVRYILKGMLNEHISKERMTHNWEVDKTPWLSDISDCAVRKDVLSCLIIWLIKNTVCSIVAVNFYVTTTSITHETRKLYYFFKEDWQRLTDTIVRDLLHQGDIIKCKSFSLGSKTKKRFNAAGKRDRKFFLKQIPIARFMLKSNNSVRIIIRYKKLFTFERKAIKERRQMFKLLFPKSSSSKFEHKYLELFKKWKSFCKPKLYFVKVDLVDAFGRVDLNQLKKYLSNAIIGFQKQEKNPELKCFVAKEYQKFISEYNQPIYIRIGSCVYRWNRGLVQGMRYSPILCEIFYSNLDKELLSEFQTESDNEISCFLRYVDDYLFITDDIKKATQFLHLLSTTGRTNTSKTQCNFSCENCEVSSNIQFCGFNINTFNLEVTRDETVYSKQVRYRMVINEGISRPYAFLKRRITQTTVPLTPLFYNATINSEETLWNNIFITLCISANKFCSLVLLIFCENSKSFVIKDILDIYKKNVAIKMCNLMVKLLLSKSEEDGVGYNIYCINHVRYLAYKALLLFCSKTHLCSLFIPSVNILIKKTNCKEGKWNSHASVVDKDGGTLQMAVKESCRRKEIVKIFNNFMSIPKSFEPLIKI